MSALTAPIPFDTAGVHARPSLGRLVAVELRKVVDTRAGFWLQVATVVLTVAAVIARAVIGDASDHTFAAMLDVGVWPAAVLLPVAGVLLVTSEWSQRTGMITFALVPDRSRVLAAKVAASLVLAVAMVAMSVGVVSAGVLASGGAWTDAPTLIGQATIYLTAGIVIAVAFGAVVLASAPALVALFALPSAWLAITSLPLFGDSGPWVDTGRALAPLTQEVLSATQWARVASALAIWMVVPLAIGAWRFARKEIAA